MPEALCLFVGPCIFVLKWDLHVCCFYKHEALTICMENPEIPGRIQMEQFIPVEIFRDIPFSRFYRNDRILLYHLFGLLVPGLMPREGENLTGIL